MAGDKKLISLSSARAPVPALADTEADSVAPADVLPAMAAATAIGDLPRQVELARRLATSQPERAAEALQRMLEAPDSRGQEAQAA